MGNLKDYATSTVLTAPSPADSGTSLVVQSGHGARFPAAPFYVTVHPPNEFPTLDNAEKLLVSSKSTDTFTISRGEADTDAKSIEAGWRISNSVFLRDLSRVKPFVNVTITTAAATAAKVGTTAGGSYSPQVGDILLLNFSNSNTANSATLNVDGSGATNIQTGGVNTSNVSLSGTKVLIWYDGTYYQLFGSQRVSDSNTSYTEISTAEIDAGTASTTRSISGRRAQYIVNKAQDGRDPSVDGAKLDTIESGADVTDATNVDAAGATMNSDTTLAGNGYFLDEDNMASNSGTKVPSQQSVKAYVDAAIAAVQSALYPIGSIYMSVNSTNPGTLFGGTWTAWGTGRVPVGVDTSQTEFNTVEKTGGEKKHTLTVAEMPSHDHNLEYGMNTLGAGNRVTVAASDGPYSSAAPITNTGGGGAHNNLQPYITCYMWKRTA